MAWRPSQALETLTFSARAASSLCSLGERLTERRCFEAMPSFWCSMVLHNAALFIVPGELSICQSSNHRMLRRSLREFWCRQPKGHCQRKVRRAEFSTEDRKLSDPRQSRGLISMSPSRGHVYDRGDVAVGKILRAGPANGRSPSVPTIHLKSSVASGSGPLRNDRRLVLVDGRSEVGEERAETREVERSSPWPNDPVRENLLAVMLVTLQIFPVVECLSH